jgi:starch phosphorylase
MNSRPAGYAMAKLIIKLINSVAEVINHDPEVKQHIKVFLLRDYNSRSDKKSIPRPT